jgi:hypothetical protein
MQLIKPLGFAGALVLAAIVGGTVIGSVLATEETDATGATSEYCDVFMESMASELGVTREALVAAGQVAAGSALDAAVAAGEVSEERATEIRERIAHADGEGCRWFGHRFGRGHGPGMTRGFLRGDVFEAAADALGIESSDLIDELRDAESLEALAEEHGVTYDEVKASVLAAVEEGMDQRRADAVIERLTTWLDGGGQLDEGRFGPGHWRERGTDGA